MELGTFGVVLVNKLSSCTTVYQHISRLDFSGLHSLKFHLQLKRIGLSLSSCNDEFGQKFSLPFQMCFWMKQRGQSRGQRWFWILHDLINGLNSFIRLNR